MLKKKKKDDLQGYMLAHPFLQSDNSPKGFLIHGRF